MHERDRGRYGKKKIKRDRERESRGRGGVRDKSRKM